MDGGLPGVSGGLRQRAATGERAGREPGAGAPFIEQSLPQGVSDRAGLGQRHLLRVYRAGARAPTSECLRGRGGHRAGIELPRQSGGARARARWPGRKSMARAEQAGVPRFSFMGMELKSPTGRTLQRADRFREDREGSERRLRGFHRIGAAGAEIVLRLESDSYSWPDAGQRRVRRILCVGPVSLPCQQNHVADELFHAAWQLLLRYRASVCVSGAVSRVCLSVCRLQRWAVCQSQCCFSECCQSRFRNCRWRRMVHCCHTRVMSVTLSWLCARLAGTVGYERERHPQCPGRGQGQEFEQTQLYKRVFALAERAAKRPCRAPWSQSSSFMGPSSAAH